MNIGYALKDGRPSSGGTPRLAFERIQTLPHHHFLVKDHTGAIDWSQAHKGCDPAWCDMCKQIDAGVAAVDVEETPSGLAYPVGSEADLRAVAQSLAKQFSLKACQKLCHEDSTQNNESLHATIARACHGKRTCESQANSWYGAVADGVNEKADPVNWRAERAELLGLCLNSVQRAVIAQKFEQKMQKREYQNLPERKERRKELGRDNRAAKTARTISGGYKPCQMNNDMSVATPRKTAAPKVRCTQCPGNKFHKRAACPTLKRQVNPQPAGNRDVMVAGIAQRLAAAKAALAARRASAAAV